jgi:CzcA family heavy metal efflux pump
VVRFALRNPHLVVVLAIIVALLGGVSVAKTPVDVFPDLRVPAVLVAVGYRGMPAAEMETSIVRRLERTFMQADGIGHMESRSLVGIGVIKVFFRQEVDVNAAISQIISLAIANLRNLPKGTLPPLVVRFDATSLPVCQMVLSSDTLSRSELYDVANYTIRNQLGNVPGVSAPPVFGGKVRQVMVYLDPAKLQAQGLAPMDVVRAIDAQNLMIPTGSAKIGDSTYDVGTNCQVETPEAFDDLPVRTANGRTTFVRDVARAVDSYSIVTNVVRVNGQHSVYLPILKQGGANTIRVVEDVKTAMQNFAGVPAGVKLDLVFDQSIYVRQAVSNLEHEGILGALLAGVMVFAFLANLRATGAVLITVPLALVAALGALYAVGETVNLMTLGGLALAVGPVIDASIVVIENVARRLAHGDDPSEAADRGATEVARPVLVSTISTLIVFLPVVFLTGIGRSLFVPLGKSVGFALAAAYVAAFTLVPVFCARFLSREAALAAEHGRSARTFDRFAARYRSLLERVIARRRMAISATLATLVASVILLAPRLGQEFFPPVDAGQFVMNVRTTPGTRVEETEKVVAGIEDLMHEVVPRGQIDTIVSNIGIFRGFAAMYSQNSGQHTATVQVKLSKEHVPTLVVVDAIRRAIRERCPGVEVQFQTGGVVSAALNFGLAAPIDIQVMDEDLEEGRALAERIKAVVDTVPGTVDTMILQSAEMPAIHVEVDRTRAAHLGLTQRDIESNLVVCLNSSVNMNPVTWIDPRTGNDYFVAGQYDESEITSFEALENVPVSLPSSSGRAAVPLRNVAALSRRTSLVESTHYNIGRTIDVLTTPYGRDIGSVAAEIEQRLKPILDTKPASARVRLLGQVASMRDSFAGFGAAIALAVVLVYLVLVAQFRSVLDPALIVVAVPLGLIGVIVTLWVTGTTINVQTFLGVMMLVGIAVSNSILLVEFANRKFAEGCSAVEAAVESGATRIRPILMTSIATVLGLAPMAANLGEGGEANVPLARAVIGGLLVSTVLTLFVVPALFVSLKQRIGR